jgi:hypothetical protein
MLQRTRQRRAPLSMALGIWHGQIMGSSKKKNRRFLSQHPACCFCGGLAEPTTIDHVPARSFFIDRKYPNGMEFPACGNCQKIITDSEDVVRLVTTLQGTSYNPNMAQHFKEKNDSIIRGINQRKPEMVDTGHLAGENPIISLGPKVQEMIIDNQRKLSLALFYKIMGAPLQSNYRMAITFYTFDKHDLIQEQLSIMDSNLEEDWIHDQQMQLQFRCKFKILNGQPDGHILFMATYLHGLIAFTLFLESEDYATEVQKKILRGPFVHKKA